MPLYFAFGSNLDPLQMPRRCPSSTFVDVGVLRDYRLHFPVWCESWAGGVASIEPAAGHRVEGVIYALSEADLLVLDEYENIAEEEYRRVTMDVPGLTRGPINVWTYIANPDPEGPSLPSTAYRDALVRGAKHHGLSADYTAMLEALAVAETAEAPRRRDG